MRRVVVAFALGLVSMLEVAAATPNEPIAVCTTCHGEKGLSETAQIPSLAAQPAPYSVIQLYLFREKQRPPQAMIDAAQGLSDDDLRHLADLIAKLPAPPPPQGAPDEARMARGRTLATQNRCGFCHNPDFAGRDNVPRLADQREDYLVKALSSSPATTSALAMTRRWRRLSPGSTMPPWRIWLIFSPVFADGCAVAPAPGLG